MKRGMTKADEKVTKVTGGKLAKSLLKVVGIGLAAGVALIAMTDKAMKKAFPQEEEGKPQEGCKTGEAGDAKGAAVAGEAGAAKGSAMAEETGAAKDEHGSRDFIRWEDEKNSCCGSEENKENKAEN